MRGPWVVRVRLLGRVAVVRGDGVDEVRGDKQRLLLCLLAQAIGEAVSSDRLVDAIWDSGDGRARHHALEAQVSRLRPRLAAAGLAIDRTGDGYRLQGQVTDTDAGALETELGAGRRALRSGELPRARQRLAAAVDLAAGPPFAEHQGHRVLQAEAVRLDELARAATEGLVDVDLAEGRAATVVPRLEAWTRQEPLREGLWARLMRAHYLCGDQSAALAAHDRLAEALADELGLDPSPAVAELRTAILRQDPGLAAPGSVEPTARPGHGVVLPTPTTALVGREGLRQQLATAVAAGARLITLTGSGGIGKTRLAIAVARDVATTSDLGVRFVDLASVTEGHQVVRETAAALGVDELPDESLVRTLLRRLADQQVLLVLDNCEHVLEPTAEMVGRLLPGLPGLAVVATSRQPLDLYGEAVWRVFGLSLPPDDADDEDAVAATEAGRLLLDRARAGQPELSLGPEEARSVARICRRLAGIPLALELAASQLTTRRPSELEAALDRHLGVLRARWRDVPDRHRTIENTIAWSYDQLDAPDRRLVDLVAVFSGAFSAAATEQLTAEVAPGIDDVPGRLDELARRSLLRREPSALTSQRHRMLEPLRRFGALRRDEAGWDVAVREAHLERAVRVLETAARRLQGPEEDVALAEIDDQIDDLRAALSWARLTGRSRAGLRAATGLSNYANLRGIMREAADRLAAFVDMPVEPGVDPVVRGRALTALCRLETRIGRLDAARHHGDQAVLVLEEGHHAGALGYAVLNRAMAGYSATTAARSLAEYDRALDLLGQAGDLHGVGFAMLMRGLALLHLDPPRAAETVGQVLEALEGTGDRNALAHGREAAALATLAQDRPRQAGEQYAGAIDLLAELGNVSCLPHALGGAASCLLAHDRPGEAAELLGAADALRRDLATVVAPYEQPFGEGLEDEVLHELGPDAGRAALARGARLSAPEAAATAATALRRP